MRAKTKKIINSIIKRVPFFIMALLSLPVYANTLINLIGNISSHEDQFCTKTACFFPEKSLVEDDVVIDGQINWKGDKNLVLHTKGNIVFKKEGKIVVDGKASVILQPGMEPGEKKQYTSTIIFEGNGPQIEMIGSGKTRLYYNPQEKGEGNKYYYDNKKLDFRQHINANNINEALSVYMLVNNVEDLRDIGGFLSGDYALSQDIKADKTKDWNNGAGFEPLKDESKNRPFSGNFDGNGYAIKKLFIYRPKEKKVGLFGMCSGFESRFNIIENLTLQEFDITGDHYVGALAGWVTRTNVFNVRIIDFSIKSRDIAGGLIGTMYKTNLSPIAIYLNKKYILEAKEYKGYVAGSSNDSAFRGIIYVVLYGEKRNRALHDELAEVTSRVNNEYIGSNNHTEMFYELKIGESIENIDRLSLLQGSSEGG